MSTYPVSLQVSRPDRFERFHVVIRLLVMVVLSALGMSYGWPFLVLFLLLPAYAAAQSASRGGAGYLVEDGPRVASAIRWVLAAYAYLSLLTDRLPDARYADNLRFEIQPQGAPAPASALWRLVKAIPVLIFLLLAGVPGALFWVVAMVLVAISGQYPATLHRYQEGLLRLTGRLLAWDASLVEEYPPLSLGDPDDEHRGALVSPHPG